jgi:DNA topoisomerase IB
LFQYLDENGQRRKIDSSEVNEYLRRISGHDFTAKDFRTWAGTVLALSALKDAGLSDSARQAKKNIVKAIKVVADQLGNTPAICRKCYVHPIVLESYSNGWLLEKLEVLPNRSRSSWNGLESDEVRSSPSCRRPGRGPCRSKTTAPESEAASKKEGFLECG